MTTTPNDPQFRAMGFEPDDSIQLRAIMLGLWRRKLMIVGTMLIVTGFTVLIVNQLTPYYLARAEIVVEPPRTNVVDIESVAPSLSTDWLTNETQAAILGSRVLAEKVVDQLRLVDHREFNPALRPPKKGFLDRLNSLGVLPDSWLSAYRSLRGRRKSSDQAASTLSPEKRRAQLREDVIGAYLGGLTIVPSDTSRVIVIEYRSSDPVLAARLANAAATIYIDDQVSAKSQQTEIANTWLQDRALELKQRVQVAARAVEKHRRQAGLINIGGSSLLAQQLSEINSRLIIARSDRAETEARFAQVQVLFEAESGVESVAAVLQSSLIQNLRGQETQVVRKIAELETQLRDAHPRMILARNELKDLQEKIESEVRKIIANLGNELEIDRVREANLEHEVARLRRELDSQTDAEITLRALETDLQTDQKLFDTILARLKETNVQESSVAQPDARIITPATVPGGPAYPNTRIILVIAVAGSMMLGILFAFILEQLDSGFRGRDQLEAASGVPVLGIVPLLSGWRFGNTRPFDDILERPDSALSESFRTLRTALLLSNVDQPPRIVLVTSSIPGEGKSTTALGLARTAAKHGQKCIIIDADTRHPTLHEAFDVAKELGLMDYLTADVPLEEIVQIDFKSGAHYILAGQRIPHSAHLLGSEKMNSLLVTLRGIYDFIVIDTPPVLALSDTLILLRQVDKTIFLVRWGKTRREAAIAGIRQVRDAGGDLAGVVLTQVDLRKQAQYHYTESTYYTYYSDSYRKNYGGG